MDDYTDYLRREPRLLESRKLKLTAWVVSALVLILVGLMRRPELKIDLPEGVSLAFLPLVHAVLNSIVACALVVAVMAIKGKRVGLHKGAIHVAMVASTLFLLCYVAYHFTTATTLYGDANKDGVLTDIEKLQLGVMRGVYLFILISHIVFAAVSLPFILFTWIYGFTNQFAKHRRIARFVFPVWLYVAVTGPICYLMLRPYY